MKKHFYLAGLLGLGLLASCSSEEPAVNPNPNEEGSALMQVQLTVANDNTRANVPTEDGEATEFAAGNLMVVFADANDIARQVYTADVKPAADKQVATVPFSVAEGSYKVYVLANYDASVTPIVANSTDMANTPFTLSAAYDGLTCPIATANKFLMANEVAPAMTEVRNDATGSEINSDGSETADGKKNVNVVKVNIERLASKVTVNDQATTTFDVKNGDATIATAELLGVDLINLNASSYFVKKQVAYTTATAFEDLYYVQDPNYTATDLKGLFHASATSIQEIAKKPKFYCLENTMQANKQNEGYATALLYKVKYTPAADQYSKLDKAASDTYSAKFKDVLADADCPDELKAADLFTAVAEDGTFYEYNGFIFASAAGAKIYRAIALNTDKSVADILTSYAAAASDVHAYTAGASYYTAYIRHNTIATAGLNEQGKYGVVRNHWYNVTVNSIKKLGNYEPTYTNTPETPIDKSDTYLQVQVTIKPWRYINQSVDL